MGCGFLRAVFCGITTSVICASAGFVSLAEAQFAVQVGSFPTLTQAQEIVDKHASDEVLGLYVHEKQGAASFPFKVVSGNYLTQLEARESAKLLQDRFDGAFIIRVAESGLPATDWEQLVPKPTTLASSSLLASSASPSSVEQSARIQSTLAFSPAMESKSTAALSKEELLLVGEYAVENSAGVPALERFIKENPGHAQVNRARIRLARRLLGRKDFAAVHNLLDTVISDGSDAEKRRAHYVKAYVNFYENGKHVAFDDFVAIASDPLQPESVRGDALRRAAGIAHAEGDYESALTAFKALSESSLPAEQRAEAAMQYAGLKFECLARFGVGSWEEVRQDCHKACTMVGVSKQDQATAALMYAETFYLERNWDEAEARLTSFVTDFADIKRECVTAMTLRGIVRFKKGDMAGAESDFRTVIAADLTKDDKFANSEPRAKAAAWMAYMCAEAGDHTGEKEFLRKIRDDFPDSTELTQVRKTYGERFDQITSD